MHKSITHYNLIRKLGEGGMGEVYLAEDTNLKRQVALKFLRSLATNNEENKRRFINEAQAAAALNHPNITQIHTVEECDGRLFIVMEYIKGQELSDIIDKNELSQRNKIEIACQLADGIKAAHDKGVIHRDIKSGNIMVKKDDQVKIMDFGLARIRGTDHITKTGSTLGTISYMSPEQVIGESVDEQSDIWSLGVVLYELFTGKLPFRGEYEASIMYSITEQEPIPVTDLKPDIPEWIAEIIHNCLQKKKDKRYSTVEEVQQALKAGAGGLKYNERKIDSSIRSIINEPFVRIGVPVLVVSLLILLGIRNNSFSPLLSIPGEENRQYLTVLPFKNIGSDSTYHTISEGLVETLSSKLSTVQRLRNAFWVVPTDELVQKNVRTAGSAHKIFNVDLAVTGSIQPISKSTRFILQLIDAKNVRQLDSKIIDVPSNDLASLQIKAVEALLEMLNIEEDEELLDAIRRGDPTQPGASEFYIRGRAYLQRTLTGENIENAINSFKKAIALDPDFALAHAALGESYLIRYNKFQDHSDVVEAEKQVKKALDIDDELPAVKLTMGIVHLTAGELEKAIEQFNDAITLEPKYVEAYLSLAKAFEEQDRYEKAEETYKKAISLQPDFYRGYNQLGSFYLNHGQYQKAIEQFLHVAELTPDNPHIYSNLGVYFMLLGQAEQATQNFKKSLSIDTTYAAVSNFGSLMFNQGQYSEAVHLYRKALQLSPNDYRIWGNLALACDWSDKPGLNCTTDTYYLKAIERAENMLQVNNKAPVVMANLAAFHASLGDTSKAISYIDKALQINADNILVRIDAIAVYELTGLREKALQYITKEVMPYIKPQPRLQMLVRDPRFQKLTSSF
ncbi:MAG: protein kinase [Balneolaceae bacterium]|nr:protein kinase [Balneolaceae bacterium]